MQVTEDDHFYIAHLVARLLDLLVKLLIGFMVDLSEDVVQRCTPNSWVVFAAAGLPED